MLKRPAALVAITPVLFAASALAQSNPDTLSADLFNNISFTQTSNGEPTSLNGSFFSVDVSPVSGTTLSSATLTYPGPGSPQVLPSDGFGGFGESSSIYATQAALHADYPFGTYTFNTNTNNGATSVAINYAADYFAPTLPYVSNFSSLNGYNPAGAHQVNFPGYTPNANDTTPYIFFTVSTQGGATAYTAGFLTPSTTSVTIPANTLAPNTTYNFELDYSDRLDAIDQTNMQFTEQGFDLRTDGSFTTGAVPSPSGGLTALVALGLFSFARQPRRSLS